jgi:hypothetical protein
MKKGFFFLKYSLIGLFKNNCRYLVDILTVNIPDFSYVCITYISQETYVKHS